MFTTVSLKNLLNYSFINPYQLSNYSQGGVGLLIGAIAIKLLSRTSSQSKIRYTIVLITGTMAVASGPWAITSTVTVFTLYFLFKKINKTQPLLDCDKLYQEGYALYENGDLRMAIGKWTTPARAGHQKSGDGMGIAHWRLNEPLLAIPYLNNSIDPRAKYYKAAALWDGKGVDRDREKAVKLWIELSNNADNQIFAADFMLGISSHIKKNYEQAIFHWTKCHKMRPFSLVCSKLGLAYKKGEGVEKDLNKAKEFLLEALQIKDDMNLLELYGLTEKPLNLEEELAEVESELEKHKETPEFAKRKKIESLLNSADVGNANVQYEVACEYFELKDFDNAVRYWSMAAQQNHADALCKLGEAQWDGRGTTKKQAEAVICWQRSNTDQAKLYLANAYWEGGIEVEKNEDTACKLWVELADKGIKDAKFSLACALFQSGKKEEAIIAYEELVQVHDDLNAKAILASIYSSRNLDFRNEKRAVELLKELANQDADLYEKTNAKSQLAQLYFFTTDETIKDEKQAVELWKELLHSPGQTQFANYYLGQAHLKGKGVDKNIPIAKQYFQSASEAGCELSRELLQKNTELVE